MQCQYSGTWLHSSVIILIAELRRHAIELLDTSYAGLAHGRPQAHGVAGRGHTEGTADRSQMKSAIQPIHRAVSLRLLLSSTEAITTPGLVDRLPLRTSL